MTSLLTLGFMPFLYYYRLKTFFIHPWGEILHLLQSIIKPRLKVLLELGSWDKVHANECADVGLCVISGFAYLNCVYHRDNPLLLNSGEESCLSTTKCFKELDGIPKLLKCPRFRNLLNGSTNDSWLKLQLVWQKGGEPPAGGSLYHWVTSIYYCLIFAH